MNEFDFNHAYEVCPHCDTEVMLDAELKVQTCPNCGKVNKGKFCAECGAKKPEPAGAWKCICGATNTGKFCAECGAKRPESNTWDCSCGHKGNTGNFCAECGAKRP